MAARHRLRFGIGLTVSGLALALTLVGCAGITAPEQLTITGQAPLQAGGSLGQTFVARQAGLAGLEIYLVPVQPGAGDLVVQLRADSQATDDLAVGRLPLRQVTAPGFYRFEWAAQPASRQRYYYARLTLEGAGQVQAGQAAGDAYLDGAAYQEDQPADAQLAFRLVYDSALAAQGAALQLVEWAGRLAAGVFLFIVPGLALLVLGWPAALELSWPARLGLAAGLSVGLYPVLMLWTYLAHLPLGAAYAWGPGTIGMLILLWRGRGRAGLWRGRLKAWASSADRWPDAVTLILLGLIFGVRFWIIRSTEYPLWGDSIQHTMIAQLIVDHGGLFASWAPYADLATFTYHFGFHAAAAVFHWVTGLAAPEAVLWTGQILNGLAVLALAPLAARLSSNRWAIPVTLLAAGLLMSLPMGYVNWGRYTQLAGQVILPTSLCLLWALFEVPPLAKRLLALTALTVAGLALTHYRMLLIAAPFVVAAGLMYWPLRPWRARAIQFAILGGVSAALFGPWFANTLAGQITRVFFQQLATPAAQTAQAFQETNSFGDFSLYLPPYLWAAAGGALAWGLWQRRRAAIILGLWIVGAVLVTNPQWLRLPGEGLVTNFALLIFAYAPASVVLGAAAGWAADRWLSGRGGAVGLTTAVMLIALWGGAQRLSALTPATAQLVTRPDIRAAQWLSEHTPAEARIGVNAFLAYDGTVAVGADAGWWLPVLARRPVTLPPITYVMERMTAPESVARVNGLAQTSVAQGWTSPAVLALARAQGVRYVYIGQRHGQVNYSGPSLQAEQLLLSPAYQQVYHVDRVWIFELKP